MPHFSLDSYAPAQVAERVHTTGVKKATMPAQQILVLAAIAGAFISFGAMYYTVAVTAPGASYGPSQVLGGFVFSLGFILVVIAGAELFTGNNLVVMAWASGDIAFRVLLRNWALVYVGNFFGCLASVFFVYLSGYLHGGNYQVGATAVRIALKKVDHGLLEAFVLGMLCNALVCLASWVSYAARTAADKVLVIIFPVSAFVAMGFEHCIANMYLVPIGMVAATDPAVVAAGEVSAEALQALSLGVFLVKNLIPVTLGNIAGGAGLVALVYYFVYLHNQGKGF
jgi:formate/nitrite transporter